MASELPLLPGRIFHIYNRGNNREDLFRSAEHYRTFLALYGRHVEPVCVTYSFCLMRNHFHLLVRIRDEANAASASHGFSKLFNAYAKMMNGLLGRTGSLFEHPFHRKLVEDEDYAQRLVAYIHLNPQRHGFVADFRTWPWSSYASLISPGKTPVDRHTVMDWFGGEADFVAAHTLAADETLETQDYL